MKYKTTAVVCLLVCLSIAVPAFAQNSVTLSWTQPIQSPPDPLSSTSIYRDSAKLVSGIQPTVLQYVDFAVSPGQTHTYWSTNTDIVGIESAPSNSVTASIPSVTVVGVTLSPVTATIGVNTTKQFAATISGSTNTAVTWTASCGAVSAYGMYTAPGIAETCTVKATSQASTTAFASASVTMTATAPLPSYSSLWAASVVPVHPANTDPNSVELGTKWSSSVSGQVIGVRYYKQSISTGTNTGTLWTSAGAVLATGTFTNQSASGWQTLFFASPVNVTAGTTYVVSYHTTHYAYDTSYFVAARNVTPLTAPINAGVYAYGTSTVFPANVYAASTYYADVMFVAGTTPTASILTSCAWLADGVTWQCNAVTKNMAAGQAIKVTVSSGSITDSVSGIYP